MKARNISWLCGVGLLAALAMLLFVRHQRSTSHNLPLAPITIREKIVAAPGVPESPAGPVVSETTIATPLSTQGSIAIKYMSLRADQTVARVNGVAITLRDLIPIPAGELADEKTMSLEMFDFLLRRAIDREVAFQAAQKNGIKLDPADQEQLKKLGTANPDPYPGYRMIQPSAEDPAKIKFEARDAQGLMLQNALMAQAGLASPYLNEAQVQEYYTSHKQEFGELSGDAAQREVAWQKIDFQIRQKLEQQTQAEYRTQQRQFLDRLQDGLGVEMARLVEVSATADTLPPTGQ